MGLAQASYLYVSFVFSCFYWDWFYFKTRF